MTWRLEITHRTMYQYNGPVYSSYNEVRMTPRRGGSQNLLSSTITVSPSASLYGYIDYFGTAVTAFDLHRVHDYLDIAASSHVEVLTTKGPEHTIDWNNLLSDDTADNFAEFLMTTKYTTLGPEVASELKDRIRSEPTPQDGLEVGLEWVEEHLSYERGITHVRSSAAEALTIGKGVCQDFSHLTIACMRSAGIPMRYVSGYLYPGESPAVGESSVGESHAWVEAWLGRWIGLDPSNHVSHIDQRYVAVGKGRDYGDVSPFTGIFYGGESSSPMVTVSITRRQ